jgi:probable HAF family extracellular repeat protein
MYSKWCLLICCAFFCLVAGLPALVYSAAYEITEVVPANGYTDSKAFGVSNGGVVVGRFFNYNQDTKTDDNKTAYRWNSATDITLLLDSMSGQSSAWAVSGGYAAGYSYNADGYIRPVRWDISTGAVTDMGTFANSTDVYGNEGFSYGVDDDGDVVGYADKPNDANNYTVYHAFLYSNAGSAKTDIGTLNTSDSYYAYGYSIAYGVKTVNSLKTVVGIANTNGWGFDPFIYDATNGIRALNKDATYSSGEWYATAINENGLIVGHVIDSATSNRVPFYWADATANPAQITLPSIISSAEIYSVNSSGQMVGVMWGSSGVDFAFVYDSSNGVVPLNRLVNPNSGWFLEAAIRINDSGQIAGYGKYNGAYRGFLLNTGTACAQPVKKNADYYDSIQAGYDEATGGQSLQIQGLQFAEALAFSRDVAVNLAGGYDCNYSDNPGFSVLNGQLTISGGAVTAANIIIR